MPIGIPLLAFLFQAASVAAETPAAADKGGDNSAIVAAVIAAVRRSRTSAVR